MFQSSGGSDSPGKQSGGAGRIPNRAPQIGPQQPAQIMNRPWKRIPPRRQFSQRNHPTAAGRLEAAMKPASVPAWRRMENRGIREYPCLIYPRSSLVNQMFRLPADHGGTQIPVTEIGNGRSGEIRPDLRRHRLPRCSQDRFSTPPCSGILPTPAGAGSPPHSLFWRLATTTPASQASTAV